MYDRYQSSKKTVECFSHRIFLSPYNITEDIVMTEGPVMLQLTAGTGRSS
jgi:hypothetical protein